jgi:hypothetical protein
MATFIPRTREELIQHLLKADFTGPFTVNKFSFMIKDEIRLSIPGVEQQEIGKDLSRKILTQAGLKTE